MQAAPTNPTMGELSVSAPFLEEAHPMRSQTPGVRGDLSSLVLDVDVQVEVYFGDASLTVEEFLEMGAGSVVELDHSIEAPVELRVRGKLIATGQLVTINGNYGLRITGMVSEEQH
jgi:flagellar motor switch protein FliN/FliY